MSFQFKEISKNQIIPFKHSIEINSLNQLTFLCVIETTCRCFIFEVRQNNRFECFQLFCVEINKCIPVFLVKSFYKLFILYSNNFPSVSKDLLVSREDGFTEKKIFKIYFRIKKIIFWKINRKFCQNMQMIKYHQKPDIVQNSYQIHMKIKFKCQKKSLQQRTKSTKMIILKIK